MPDTARLKPFEPTPRARVKRHPERAHYDRETVFAILGPSCSAISAMSSTASPM